MKKIRVVQVGMGRMGNEWLKEVMASQEVEFAGFVEIDDQIIEKRAKEHGLDRKKIFKSLPEALRKVEADGLINVTPLKVHEEICFTASKRQVEKKSHLQTGIRRSAATSN